jgi:hypothetical protein
MESGRWKMMSEIELNRLSRIEQAAVEVITQAKAPVVREHLRGSKLQDVIDALAEAREGRE